MAALVLVVTAQQPEGPRANLGAHSTLQRLIQVSKQWSSRPHRPANNYRIFPPFFVPSLNDAFVANLKW
jgi:hypothetical protein